MKKTAIFQMILISVVLVVVVLGCKKDDNNSTSSQYRITEAKEYYGGILTGKYVIEYEGDKMVGSHYYELYEPIDSVNLTESERTTIEYPNDSKGIMIYYAQNENDVWVEDEKEEFTFEGGNITNVLYSGIDMDTWYDTYKNVRQFEGNNLMSSFYYYMDAGEWISDNKEIFNYDNNMLSSVINYYHDGSYWIQNYKAVVTYAGSQIGSINEYDYNDFNNTWIDEWKSLYQYTGNNISSIADFDYDNGNWVSEGTTQYLYDNNGNVISWTEDDGGELYKLEFTYEKGQGNWAQITEADSEGWFYYHTTPFPTKASPNKTVRIKQRMQQILRLTSI